MQNSPETQFAIWIIGDPEMGNEFHLLVENTREDETYDEEVERVRELLAIHVELMNSLNFTGAIHVCRACAGLN